MTTHANEDRELSVLLAGFDEAVRALRVAAVELFNVEARKCESPIERLMLAALAYEFWMDGAALTPAWMQRDGIVCALEPQKMIGAYRADFALTISSGDFHARPARVVIECDGHDFHEKTKEQAARDKLRDRVLTTRGWSVLRFTGAEIVRDPRGCARAASDLVARLMYGHNHDPLEEK